jgi:uncharacterized protein with HEPN domain
VKPGCPTKDFGHDAQNLTCLLMTLLVIGEAAKQLPKSVKDKAPDTPWKEIVGMRNKIAHEYFGVDNKIVWDTTKRFLPKLNKQLAKLMREEK